MAAAAAAYPPWVIFEHYCVHEVQGCSSSIADTNTLARCCTTGGHPIDVSLCLAAAPEGSRVCVQLPEGVVSRYAVVLAAHGDSVLLQISIETESTDNFVYSAGDATAEPARPPSLSLLPPHFITYEDRRRHTTGCHYLEPDSTGLLRGDNSFMVAELKMEYMIGSNDKDVALHLLRSSSSEWQWQVKRPVTVISGFADDAGACVQDLASSWQANLVIPVGDQMLCWVYLARGLLFSDDMFDESPSLRYVPLPKDPDSGLRSVGVTADGRTIKFVNVFPRCYCGGAGKSMCRASHHAYTIHTWTLRMDDVDMAWVMDGSLDATQLWALDLWALDGYKGLPHVKLDSSVVSMDAPDAICFMVRERYHVEHVPHGDETIWRIMVDTKSMTLGSVFRYPEGRKCASWVRPLASRVSKYFNPRRGQPGPAAKTEAMVNLRNRRINSKLQAID